MSIQRNELQELYSVTVLQAQPSERPNGRDTLRQKALLYLNTADPWQRFSEAIVEVFSLNISQKTPFDCIKGRTVFCLLEKYVLNLLNFPWKREFHKITMYSGYYKTWIEPFLKDAWKLLVLIGYEKTGMCLELKQLPKANRLQELALEFFLCSVECGIYNDVLLRVFPLGVTLRNIYERRNTMAGDSDALTKALIRSVTSNQRNEEVVTVFPKLKEHEAVIKVSDFGDVQPVSKFRQSERYMEAEVRSGIRVPVDGNQSNESHMQMGGLTVDVPLSDSDNNDNGCDKRTESFEAMLREVTPEMISDINIRRKIMNKLVSEKMKPDRNQSPDEVIHGSLPLYPEPRVRTVASESRPHTEPLLIPKQAKTSSKLTIKDNEPSLAQLHTEPLMVPLRPKISSKLTVRGNDANSSVWQCGVCFYTNSTRNSKTCKSCQKPRSDA